MRKLAHIVLCFVIMSTFLFSPILTEQSDAATKTYNVAGGQLIFDTVSGNITGYTGDFVNLTIPATINGVKVKGIGLGAFTGCKNLTSVTLPEGMKTIEDRVFWECEKLASINIPDSVTQIGTWFAIYCNKLAAITVGSKNTAYATQDGVLFNKAKTALLRFPGGKSGAYAIPETVKTIGEGAFYGCYNITDITIPNGVTAIGDQAFCNCVHLGNISLPDSLTSLGYLAFTGGNAEEITAGANNKNYSSIDGVLFNKAGTTLITFPGARSGSYAIPEGVTTILDNAFTGCNNLTDVYFPASVAKIGQFVFGGCSSLEQAFFYGNAPSMGRNVFDLVSPKFKVFYLADKKGFTNPWNGYETEVFSSELQPPEAQPDIMVTDITWSPQQPVKGDEVTFSVTIKNQGAAKLDNEMVNPIVFLVDGKPVSETGTNKTPIMPGEFLTLTAESSMYRNTTWTADNGAFKISVRVDSKVQESRLRNNTYEKMLFISPITVGNGDGTGIQFSGASSWAVVYLDMAVNMGFVAGALNGRTLNSSITREEFAVLAVNFYEQVTGQTAPLPEGKTFLDCDNPYVLKAFALKITAGVGDGTKFEPNSTLTRQQMATMITKTLKACYPSIILLGSGQSDFKDQAKFASYAVEPAKFMARYGITVGDGKGSFDPTSNCTIEQTVIFLVKAYQLRESYSYQ